MADWQSNCTHTEEEVNSLGATWMESVDVITTCQRACDHPSDNIQRLNLQQQVPSNSEFATGHCSLDIQLQSIPINLRNFPM